MDRLSLLCAQDSVVRLADDTTEISEKQLGLLRTGKFESKAARRKTRKEAFTASAKQAAEGSKKKRKASRRSSLETKGKKKASATSPSTDAPKPTSVGKGDPRVVVEQLPDEDIIQRLLAVLDARTAGKTQAPKKTHKSKRAVKTAPKTGVNKQGRRWAVYGRGKGEKFLSKKEAATRATKPSGQQAPATAGMSIPLKPKETACKSAAEAPTSVQPRPISSVVQTLKPANKLTPEKFTRSQEKRELKSKALAEKAARCREKRRKQEAKPDQPRQKRREEHRARAGASVGSSHCQNPAPVLVPAPSQTVFPS